jgi:hypothetical protein
VPLCTQLRSYLAKIRSSTRVLTRRYFACTTPHISGSLCRASPRHGQSHDLSQVSKPKGTSPRWFWRPSLNTGLLSLPVLRFSQGTEVVASPLSLLSEVESIAWRSGCVAGSMGVWGAGVASRVVTGRAMLDGQRTGESTRIRAGST